LLETEEQEFIEPGTPAGRRGVGFQRRADRGEAGGRGGGQGCRSND
jgi:hypothetical protein